MPKHTTAMSPSKCNRVVAAPSLWFSQVRVSHEIHVNDEWIDQGGVMLNPAEARRLGRALVRLADWAAARKGGGAS